MSDDDDSIKCSSCGQESYTLVDGECLECLRELWWDAHCDDVWRYDEMHGDG